jgi:hypothetical protein
VPLQKFSKELVHDVFMVIEEPESPIIIKASNATEEGTTIGQFYTQIKNTIHTLGRSSKKEWWYHFYRQYRKTNDV